MVSHDKRLDTDYITHKLSRMEYTQIICISQLHLPKLNICCIEGSKMVGWWFGWLNFMAYQPF